MTVALYVRVSTDEQAKEGFSLEAQKDILAAYCKVRGWSDYRYYVDDGYTGSTMDRPALKRVLYEIREGRIEQFVVMKLDRLSRSQKDTLYLIEDVFLKNGVGFHSTKETLDTTSPVGKLMIGILSSFAQFERETLIERVTMGRRKRVSTGLWAGGRIPFGYDWDKETQTLTINHKEAQVVREIYSRFLHGHAYNAIAEWASSRITQRSLDHTGVKDMLRRVLYTGRFHNNGDLVDGTHEPIIEVSTWERVQREMDLRSEGRTPAGDYLLSGLLECGLCGSPVIHIKVRKRTSQKAYYSYYACKRQHVRPKGKDHSCKLGYVSQEKLDTHIVDIIRHFSIYPEALAQKLRMTDDNVAQNLRTVRELQREVEDINERLNSWYLAFEDKTMDKERVRRRIDALYEKQQSLLQQISDLDIEPPEDRTDLVLDSIRRLNSIWDDMTFDERQTAIRTIIQKIVLSPDGDPNIIWNT